MENRDAGAKIGKLIQNNTESGFVCIRPNQGYTVRRGLFGRKEKKIYDEIGWVNESDTPVSWGVVDASDASYLKHDQLKLVGKVYDIQWLDGSDAQEVYTEHFDYQT